MSKLPTPGFWAGRRVLLTGHTGFKGSWAALWLHALGAEVTGFALPPEGTDHHFGLAGVDALLHHVEGDLRDPEALAACVAACRPQAVLHLGAQALVRRGLADPAGTFATNVQGTLNLLTALRTHAPESPVLVVTSDKVYRNDDSGRAFTEDDPLGGKDPYSASKAACELLVGAWRQSYGAPVATVRGGNVIGGGDFAEDRVIPDTVRAAKDGLPVRLRHPGATRPWQHVLDCLNGYLLRMEAFETALSAPALNIGPRPGKPATVAAVVEALQAALGTAPWQPAGAEPSVEARMLSLNPEAAHRLLGWSERLDTARALAWTGQWYRAWLDGAHMAAVSRDQLNRFSEGTL